MEKQESLSFMLICFCIWFAALLGVDGGEAVMDKGICFGFGVTFLLIISSSTLVAVLAVFNSVLFPISRIVFSD